MSDNANPTGGIDRPEDRTDAKEQEMPKTEQPVQSQTAQAKPQVRRAARGGMFLASVRQPSPPPTLPDPPSAKTGIGLGGAEAPRPETAVETAAAPAAETAKPADLVLGFRQSEFEAMVQGEPTYKAEVILGLGGFNGIVVPLMRAASRAKESGKKAPEAYKQAVMEMLSGARRNGFSPEKIDQFKLVGRYVMQTLLMALGAPQDVAHEESRKWVGTIVAERSTKENEAAGQTAPPADQPPPALPAPAPAKTQIGLGQEPVRQPEAPVETKAETAVAEPAAASKPETPAAPAAPAQVEPGPKAEAKIETKVEIKAPEPAAVPREAADSGKKVCAMCGRRNEAAAAYCQDCGSGLDQGATPAAPKPVAAKIVLRKREPALAPTLEAPTPVPSSSAPQPANVIVSVSSTKTPAPTSGRTSTPAERIISAVAGEAASGGYAGVEPAEPPAAVTRPVVPSAADRLPPARALGAEPDPFANASPVAPRPGPAHPVAAAAMAEQAADIADPGIRNEIPPGHTAPAAVASPGKGKGKTKLLVLVLVAAVIVGFPLGMLAMSAFNSRSTATAQATDRPTVVGQPTAQTQLVCEKASARLTAVHFNQPDPAHFPDPGPRQAGRPYVECHGQKIFHDTVRNTYDVRRCDVCYRK